MINLRSGERINLIFERDLWRLPIFAKPKSSRPAPPAPHSAALLATSNPYSVLDVDVCEEDTETMGGARQPGDDELAAYREWLDMHACWCHPVS